MSLVHGPERPSWSKKWPCGGADAGPPDRDLGCRMDGARRRVRDHRLHEHAALRNTHAAPLAVGALTGAQGDSEAARGGVFEVVRDDTSQLVVDLVVAVAGCVDGLVGAGGDHSGGGVEGAGGVAYGEAAVLWDDAARVFDAGLEVRAVNLHGLEALVVHAIGEAYV